MTVFAETLRLDTPAGSDSPTEADDRMRETKAALVERLNVDHYFAESATDTVDGAYTGEHRKITFYGVLAAKPVLAAGKCAFYLKTVSAKPELFFEDSDGTEIQLSAAGKINITATNVANDMINDLMILLRNNQWLMAANQAGDGEVGLIKANTDDKPVLGQGAKTYDSTAPTEDDDVTNKAYVDAAHGYFRSGATVFNDHVHTAQTFEDLDLSAVVGANAAIVYLEVYSNGVGHFTCKEKGADGTYAQYVNSSSELADNGAGCGTAAFGEVTNFRNVVVGTNAAGVIEIAYSDAADTLTIKVRGYCK